MAAAGEVEFGVDVAEVVFDGFGAEEELLGDFLVGHALGGEVGDVVLAFGEGIGGEMSGCGCGVGVGVEASEVVGGALGVGGGTEGGVDLVGESEVVGGLGTVAVGGQEVAGQVVVEEGAVQGDVVARSCGGVDSGLVVGQGGCGVAVGGSEAGVQPM